MVESKDLRMGRLFTILLLLLFSGLFLRQANAVTAEQGERTVLTRIVEIERGEPTLVFLETGRVLRLSSSSAVANLLLTAAFSEESSFEISYRDLGRYDEVTELEYLGESARDKWFEASGPSVESRRGLVIEPHAIPQTPAGVYAYMKSRPVSGGECFHRAYLWAYDTWTRQKTFTSKTFLFFTRKYIRRYNYGWWFHVAPMFVHNGQETMIDPTYTRGPRTMRQWTNNFMRNDAACPVISKYGGREQHENQEWCYVRKTSMYYYHPNSVMRADAAGRIETHFDSDGLYFSERNARRR